MTYPTPPGFYPYSHNDRMFYQAAGPLMIRYSAGRIEFGLRLEEKHMNAGGMTHGGALMYLMDMQLSLAAAFEGRIKGFASTVQLNSDFVAPTSVGQWVQASSRIIRRARRLVFIDGLLTADGEKTVMRANAIINVPDEAKGDWDMAHLLPPEYIPD